MTTEASTTDIGRSYAVAAWLAAQTSLSNQSWTFTNSTIITPANATLPGQPVTLTLQVADTNLSAARITWEALDQDPIFGATTYTFTPDIQDGSAWVEAEVQWPDGRRSFATNLVFVSSSAPPIISQPKMLAGGAFSFTLTGAPQTSYIIQASTDMKTWAPITTNALPIGGILPITDSQASTIQSRYYRAILAPALEPARSNF